LAEWLVKHGTPFREAHHQVGGFVAFCNQKGIKLNEASLDDMKAVIPTATAECLALFNPRKSVEGRALEGGTAPIRVAEQIARWQELLKD
jgi:argininosuccinate lyase